MLARTMAAKCGTATSRSVRWTRVVAQHRRIRPLVANEPFEPGEGDVGELASEPGPELVLVNLPVSGCLNLLEFVVLAILAIAFGAGQIDLALAIVLAVVSLAGLWLIRRTIRRMFAAPFAHKSQALDGATAEIHAVERVEPSSETEFPEEMGEEDLAFYEIEATIAPDTARAEDLPWEADELCLIDADRLAAAEGEMESGHPIRDVRLVEGGKYADYSGEPCNGAQRIRFVVGLPKAIRRVKFLYYTAEFGEIALPE